RSAINRGWTSWPRWQPDGRGGGERSWGGPDGGAMRARIREVLPRQGRRDEQASGGRAGAGDLPRAGGGARRAHLGGEPGAGDGRDVPLHAAGGDGGARATCRS